MTYTPGVARVCRAIAEDHEKVFAFTSKANSVAVVTDGSAILGLGNLGPEAALPVMEGKVMLFKEFADIDGWPLCLGTQDVDRIVDVVAAIAPSFGGINLEDISAPRCFEVERRLRGLLDIPVFHDDQHGTAIVVLAALTNALRVIGKKLTDVRITMAGAGAAGTAVLKLLLGAGASQAIVCDDQGSISTQRPGMDDSLKWIAEHTNRDGYAGDLAGAMRGADVFIGLSAPGILSGDDIKAMAPNAIVFALANPDPEVDPDAAMEHAAVVATGRSDYPNQINNVLAFPGVFRGLLDAQSRFITDDMLVAAAQALADVVSPDEIGPHYMQAPAHGHRAPIRAARGDVAGAVEDVQHALDFARRSGESQVLFPALADAALPGILAGSLLVFSLAISSFTAKPTSSCLWITARCCTHMRPSRATSSSFRAPTIG